MNYAPFDGDGRTRHTPTLRLPNTQPRAVTNGQARALIDRFCGSGHSTHSGAAGTLWVLLIWLQEHKRGYRLRAHPGEGYFIESDGDV